MKVFVGSSPTASTNNLGKHPQYTRLDDVEMGFPVQSLSEVGRFRKRIATLETRAEVNGRMSQLA